MAICESDPEGLTCVYHRGHFVVASRNKFAGAPNCDGYGSIRFLREPGNIERLREGLQHVATLTPEGLEEFRVGYDRYSVDSLSDIMGSCILDMIAKATAENPLPIFIDLDFALSDFCDWAYVVDLDQNTFEVFGDREHKKNASTTRFIDVGGDRDAIPALIKSFPFSQLPDITYSGFLSVLVAGMEEQDRGYGRNYAHLAMTARIAMANNWDSE